MTLSTHYKRILTALILVAVLAGAISAGGWAMRIAVLAASLLAMLEFLDMSAAPRAPMATRLVGLALTAMVVLSQAGGPVWTLAALSLCFGITALRYLFSFGIGAHEARFERHAALLMGLLYIPLALQMALYLSPAEQCLVILTAIASDTGGYYAGSLWGKHKLWPAVSPKKSWEGLFGGLALCLAVCAGFGHAGKYLGWPLPAFPLWGWLLLGLALQQAALFGDFFESALKRTHGIKDSGTILPGHGGMLDRIDSLLFVLPAYMAIRLVATLWL